MRPGPEDFRVVGPRRGAAAEIRTVPGGRRALGRLGQDRGAVAALAVLLTIALLAVLVPAVSAYGYDDQQAGLVNLPPRIPGLERLGIADGSRVLEGRRKEDLGDTEKYPPGTVLAVGNERLVMGVVLVDVTVDAYAMAGAGDSYHWLGTDYLGRDALTRLFRGARVSLLIALVAVAAGTLLGTAYGALAGYYGGGADFWLMRVAEVVDALPQLVVMTLFIMALGSGLRAIVLALVLRGWVPVARLVRAQVYRFKGHEYVLAARTMGAGDGRMIMRHILPQTVGPVITRSVLAVPSAIFSEAFLAYIGLGVQAPEPSLGVLLSDGQRALLQYPWQLFFPALLISALMLAASRLADGLRDALDPQGIARR